MTMWAVTQTTRFKAAVAGAGIVSWQSYYGQNLIDQWMKQFFGASVYDDPAVYAKSSAINFIKNVKTPTLIVVGERDAETPAPQSFELAEEHRWVLQSPVSLAQAAVRLGALALGPQIAASIERERVLLLRSALGPELYRESVSAASTSFAAIAREPLKECSTTDAVRALVAVLLTS